MSDLFYKVGDILKNQVAETLYYFEVVEINDHYYEGVSCVKGFVKPLPMKLTKEWIESEWELVTKLEKALK